VQLADIYSLRKRAIKFKIVKLPVDEHGDLSDYLEQHGAEKLKKLIAGRLRG